MDWSLCILCQSDDGDLVDPEKSAQKSYCGYTSLSSRLLAFNSLNALPLPINLAQLAGEDFSENGMVNNLKVHHAKWHQSCYKLFDNQKLARVQASSTKRKYSEISSPETRQLYRSQSNVGCSSVKCFFCDSESGDMHQVSTMSLDNNIRKCATEISDSIILAKLSEGDMVSREAWYHKLCLTGYTNKYRNFVRNKSKKEMEKNKLQTIALSEVIVYIEESLGSSSDITPSIKLTDVVKFYGNRLRDLKVDLPNRINSTHLKSSILEQCPALSATHVGRHVYLAYSDDIGAALHFTKENSANNQAFYLAKASQIIRKEVLSSKQSFNGTFSKKNQLEAVPRTLLFLINAIAGGSKLQEEEEIDETILTSALAMSQLLMFNCVKERRQSSKTHRHDPERETPLPIYLGLKIHSLTRSRKLIDILSNLGLCISYDRILTISTALGNNICKFYENEGIVCPPNLRKGIFTTVAFDNIDHNPSSITSKESFHGSAISVTQHLELPSDGIQRQIPVIEKISAKGKVKDLPQSFTSVYPLALKPKDILSPVADQRKGLGSYHLAPITQNEVAWLENFYSFYQKGEISKDGVRDYVHWSAYHASQTLPIVNRSCDITALLPLFRDQAHTPAMVQHAMKITLKQIEYLNHGQTPVLVMDQPLFALAKTIQWEKPELFGDKFLLMFGDLHIEMTTANCLGDLVIESGWDKLLTDANVITSGKAQSLLKGKPVTLCRYNHQVTACALYIAKKKAYEDYQENTTNTDKLLLQADWEQQCEQDHPQFKFWNLVLQFELVFFEFIRSLRTGNFALYVQTIELLVPWMFALDHHHYARWLSVHLSDMKNLDKTHPSVYQEFCKGKFVVKKTNRSFSLMALDQNHEQENDRIKGIGGAIGLTHDDSALRRWLISGPEIARVLEAFEDHPDSHSAEHHHNCSPTAQIRFFEDVTNTLKLLDEFGNPFMDDSKDLFVLDSKAVMNETAVNNLYSLVETGIKQSQLYFKERLIECKIPVSDTIKKNNLYLFKTSKNTSNKSKAKVDSLMNDCALFSRLFIACQSRELDLDEFFMHENQSTPPSLSLMGKMRTATKSDLLDCLPTAISIDIPKPEAKVLDGAFVVNTLAPTGCKTFLDYAEKVFIPYLKFQALDVQRIDLVWDVYLENSLKSGTREKRGEGVRRKVTSAGCLPRNWQSFLRCDENKKELFPFLSKMAIDKISDKLLFCTDDNKVICNHDVPLDEISPCNHEEGDTRIFLHLLHASKNFSTLVIKSVDTDIVVLAIAFFRKLNINKLWIEHGTGKNLKYIAIHEIVSQLSQTICNGLPFFHSFSGCDNTSAFYNKGKVTAWKTWQLLPELSDVFDQFSGPITEINEDAIEKIELFVVTLYSRTCNTKSVNAARRILFARENRQIDSIPPTKHALIEHLKRAIYQAGFVWAQSLNRMQKLPSPLNWGWQDVEGTWHPLWTTLPEASKACGILRRCGCEKRCTGNCKCYRCQLPCTQSCTCGGHCYQL